MHVWVFGEHGTLCSGCLLTKWKNCPNKGLLQANSFIAKKWDLKGPFTLPNMCLLFQVIVETLENTTLLPFSFVLCTNTLFSCFSLEKLRLGFFWTWKGSDVHPLAFCHPPSFMCFNFQTAQGDCRPMVFYKNISLSLCVHLI